MSDQQLTAGALLRYLRGNTTEKAILQVLGIKIIENNSDDTSTTMKRYRLMLSDGIVSFSSCMLGTQMNKLIEMNKLKENSIIRIDRVMVNAIDKQQGRLMLMLYDLEVLWSDFQRIGDPAPLSLTDIASSQHQVTSAAAASPTTNINQQGSRTLPAFNQRNNMNSSTPESNRSQSKGTSAIDRDRIVNINALNPYMNKWTIKARVSSKSQVRNYSNARGPGKLFSCDLVDQSGEIRAAAFNAECDKLYPLIEVGKVFYIARASLKPANRQFNTLNNDYEMAFNYDTCIEECDENDGPSIPQIQFNFVAISEIANRPANSLCDVIGVVKSVSNLETIVSKTSQKEFTKRELLLIDENASIGVTLWGEQAEQYSNSDNPVIAFKGLRIGDFNGRTLSTLNSTSISLNPVNTPRTAQLRTWFDTEGKEMDLPDLSKGSDMGNQQAPFKTLAQIANEGLGSTDKADYINVKAIITLFRKDSAVYMMCPEEKCGKKVVDENNGTFRCEKCNKTYDHFKWSYMLSAEISDSTSSQWISAFRNEAEALLGVTADEIGRHKMNQEESQIDDVFRKSTNRELIIRLRAKADPYNDERRIRFTCVRVSEVDWLSYGRRLVDEITHM